MHLHQELGLIRSVKVSRYSSGQSITPLKFFHTSDKEPSSCAYIRITQVETFVDISSLIRLRAIGNKADLREETSVKRHDLQPGDSLPFCKAISPHFRAPIVAEDLVAHAYL